MIFKIFWETIKLMSLSLLDLLKYKVQHNKIEPKANKQTRNPVKEYEYLLEIYGI